MIRRVIVHVGTEKTGTSALQQYMFDQRDEHAACGVYYPPTHNIYPLHKWLTKPLKRGNAEAFVKAIDAGVAAAPAGTHTVFFSQEGIHGAWNSFPDEGKDGLRKAAARYPLEIWVYFRDPLAYMVSLYIEMVRRPPHINDSARERSLDEMLLEPTFIENFDYTEFVENVGDLVGSDKVIVRPYTGSTIGDVCRNLGLPQRPVEERHHISIGAPTVERLRQLNALSLQPDEHLAARNAIIAEDDPSLPRFVPTDAATKTAEAYRVTHGGLHTSSGQALRDLWI